MARLIIFSFALFVVAALFEIGGGYLIWKWLREHKKLVVGLAGGVILFGYGIIQTFQIVPFGRAYAAYGGVFIVASMLWGFIMDKQKADRFDILGALVALAGTAIIMYAPR